MPDTERIEKLKAQKERKNFAPTVVSLLCAALMLYFVIKLSVPGTSDLTMNGMNITLPDGYTCTYGNANYSVWKYNGTDQKVSPLFFDANIKGPEAQLFGTAEEVIASCGWLENLELYVNPNGVRMARGYNMEDPEQPECRYYVEGDPAVFLISIHENTGFYDTAACEKMIRSTADRIIPSGKAEVSSEARINELSGCSPEQLIAKMTLQQKAYQMVQPASYNVSPLKMRQNCYGSLLSQKTAYSLMYWQELTDRFQTEALRSETGIPYLYGNDDVHGVNYCLNAVIFPHNIGIGAADDPELTRQMGTAVAKEALLCHMPWNFAPCVARSVDPRWGRTYECYGSDTALITRLGSAYTRGLTEGGAIACAKHFLGDGDVVYGTGEGDRRIDRGNAVLTDEEIEAEMNIYRELIESGALTVMISHSSLNGVKMHENGEYILKLKEETGFRGFAVSDWNAVQNIPGSDYRDKVIRAVNAGIDMLMEVDNADDAAAVIVQAVKTGRISEARVDDAVKRILYVKQQAGLLNDPFFGSRETVYEDVGNAEYRALAEQLVEKSLVLLKNDNGLLPLREGMTVYVTGPAADNPRAQCGGWTVDWNGAQSDTVPGVTTIENGLKQVCAEHGICVSTDPAEADLIILCVGEKPYAEWLGDTPDPSLYGPHGLTGNKEAVEAAVNTGKPVVTLIVAGRQILLNDADLAGWNSAVMCYLPGSEGTGVARVLCGEVPFCGHLPSPWYHTVDEIGTYSYRWPAGYAFETASGSD